MEGWLCFLEYFSQNLDHLHRVISPDKANRSKNKAHSRQGDTGFFLIPNIDTFLPKSLGYSPVISTIPGKEAEHRPASPYHRDPAPTSTDLQDGLIPEGSCRVAALSLNIIRGSHLPQHHLFETKLEPRNTPRLPPEERISDEQKMDAMSRQH